VTTFAIFFTFFVVVVLLPTLVIFKAPSLQVVASGMPTGAGPNWATLVPPFCAAISFTSYHLFQIGIFLVPQVTFGSHMESGALNLAARTLLWVGLVIPWFVGAYFAVLALRRAGNLLIRTIGAIELVLCLFFAWFWLLVTVGGVYLG